MEFVSKVNNNNYYESHNRLHRKEMMGIRHSFKLSAMELFLVTQKEFTPAGLEITPVRSSGASRFSTRASNFVFLLAPRARAQASRSPTKFLIMILRRKDKF